MVFFPPTSTSRHLVSLWVIVFKLKPIVASPSIGVSTSAEGSSLLKIASFVVVSNSIILSHYSVHILVFPASSSPRSNTRNLVDLSCDRLWPLSNPIVVRYQAVIEWSQCQHATHFGQVLPAIYVPLRIVISTRSEMSPRMIISFDQFFYKIYRHTRPYKSETKWPARLYVSTRWYQPIFLLQRWAWLCSIGRLWLRRRFPLSVIIWAQ